MWALPDDPKARPVGVDNPNKAVEILRSAVQQKITPSLDVAVDTQETEGVKVVRLIVPRGDDVPYAIEDNKIYVRDEAETNLAVRDEIVQLVRRTAAMQAPVAVALPEAAPVEPCRPTAKPHPRLMDEVSPPRTGVEIVATEERGGIAVSHHARSAKRQRGSERHTQIGAQAVALCHQPARRASRSRWIRLPGAATSECWIAPSAPAKYAMTWCSDCRRAGCAFTMASPTMGFTANGGRSSVWRSNALIRVGILTVSDRSARGERTDASGPLLRQIAERQGWMVEREGIVPDESLSIQTMLAGLGRRRAARLDFDHGRHRLWSARHDARGHARRDRA